MGQGDELGVDAQHLLLTTLRADDPILGRSQSDNGRLGRAGRTVLQ